MSPDEVRAMDPIDAACVAMSLRSAESR
jgi:hypothetical protein